MRTAQVNRNTLETRISVSLNLDGTVVHANGGWNEAYYGAKNVLPPDILIRGKFSNRNAAPLLKAVTNIAAR